MTTSLATGPNGFPQKEKPMPPSKIIFTISSHTKLCTGKGLHFIEQNSPYSTPPSKPSIPSLTPHLTAVLSPVNICRQYALHLTPQKPLVLSYGRQHVLHFTDSCEWVNLPQGMDYHSMLINKPNDKTFTEAGTPSKPAHSGLFTYPEPRQESLVMFT